jgi:hypothetical protein
MFVLLIRKQRLAQSGTVIFSRLPLEQVLMHIQEFSYNRLRRRCHDSWTSTSCSLDHFVQIEITTRQRHKFGIIWCYFTYVAHGRTEDYKISICDIEVTPQSFPDPFTLDDNEHR